MKQWIDEVMPTFISQLEYIVNIDSGSRDFAGVEKVGAFFESQLSKLGWLSKRIGFGEQCGDCWQFQNKDYEYFDILLLGHMDTVFPQGTAAQRPFTIKEGKAYGPGVADMKAGLLLGYHALKALQEEGGLDGRSICFALNSEEEVSSKNTRQWIEELAKRSKLVLVLEAARPNGALVIERKGLGRYELDFTGAAAHAGVNPQHGASAIVELGRWITALHNLTDFSKGTTVNVGVVSGGTAANVVAEKAAASVDIRVCCMEEFYKIQEAIAQLQSTPRIDGVRVMVNGGLTRPPMRPLDGTQLVCRALESVGREVGVEISWVATGGGSDGNFSAALGIPTIDGLGPVGGAAHSSHEYLEMDSIGPRLMLLKVIIERMTDNN